MIELSIIMPCLNEAGTVGACVLKAKRFLDENNVNGEIIVVDNGSSDGSADIAREAGAKVVGVPEKGYGNAIMGGIAAAHGDYIIVGDADDSYDFSALMPFLKKLREGTELVVGDRFKGGVRPGAMTFSHKYIGNPVLTGFGNLLFGYICNDWHCGLRGFRTSSVLKLNLKSPGMEFASEIIVKAKLAGLKIAELPVALFPAGRSHRSHLRSWKDGLRHVVLIVRLKLNF